MKNRNKLIGIVGLISIIVLSTVLVDLIRDRYPDCLRNVRNSKKIEVGMSVDSVLSIMGIPDTTFFNPFDSTQLIYQYITPPFSDDLIRIYSDKMNQVVLITGYGQD